MTRTIFYSWQDDTPTSVGRNFLRDILDKVCRDISKDTNVIDALRVDSDTQDTPGQAAIVDTILKKIDTSTVVVSDLTFVGKRQDGRCIPNPNVLIEYGWALKSVTPPRVISVMNEAYGKATGESLPFNITHIRWPIRFSLSESSSAEEKNKVREQLIKELRGAICISLKTIQPDPVPQFEGTTPKDGPARFRAEGEVLGIDIDSEKEVAMAPGPAVWFRLMPKTVSSKYWSVYKLKEKIFPEGGRLPLKPIFGNRGLSLLRAGDGFGIYGRVNSKDTKTTRADTVVFVFASGEIWSIDTAKLSFQSLNNNKLPLLEKPFIETIEMYSKFLIDLDLKPPFRWVAGISGIKGRRFQYRSIDFPCVADIIQEEGEYGDGKISSKASLSPFFDKIYDKCGLSRSDFFTTC